MPALADVVICLMAIIGIVLFTVFGPMQTSSNIFYANACSVTYRSMEFNLGVHLIFMYRRHPTLTSTVHRLFRKNLFFVLLFFSTLWWLEVGQPLTASTQTTCLRLYFWNACLQDHHAFFVRGCLLAFALLMATDTSVSTNTKGELQLTQMNCTAIVFCWLVCIAEKMVLDVTFSGDVIAVNQAQVSVICLGILRTLSFFGNSLVKPALVQALGRRFIHPEFLPSCP